MKKLVSLLLALAMVLSCTAAMAAVDPAKVTETTSVTEYVKISVAEYGDMIIRLYPEVAPKTVENFQNLVAEGFYDGLTFHRIVPDFVIQTGDPDADGTGGSDKTIKGEIILKNKVSGAETAVPVEYTVANNVFED